ncbi:MAG: SRPBCC family protein [Halobellus sp.]|uniref:SRPBCC family protein n=1 Tax=Halobellus sp. TaxID=1979212 RepID=UPI0035D42446
MRNAAEIVIGRPPEAVFEYMDVPENQARISPRLSNVETLGTFDNGGKRASYTYQLLGLEFDGEVHGTVHDPPERIVFDLTGDIEGRIEWEFEATEGGTRVRYTAEYDLGLPQVAELLLRPVTNWDNRRELKQILRQLAKRVAVDEDARSA